MIPRGVEVYIGLDPIDLRWGFERLSGIVAERVGRSVRSGALFVFFGRRRESLKVVFSDGSGLCIFYKRLDKGRFRLPTATDEHARVLHVETRVLEDLLDGIDLDAPTRH